MGFGHACSDLLQMIELGQGALKSAPYNNAVSLARSETLPSRATQSCILNRRESSPQVRSRDRICKDSSRAFAPNLKPEVGEPCLVTKFIDSQSETGPIRPRPLYPASCEGGTEFKSQPSTQLQVQTCDPLPRRFGVASAAIRLNLPNKAK